MTEATIEYKLGKWQATWFVERQYNGVFFGLVAICLTEESAQAALRLLSL